MSRSTRSKLRRVAALLALALLIIWFARQPHTPPINDEEGRIVPGSIASLESVEIGGVEQSLLIRGRDANKPVLFFLHGGPGLALMPLSHEFQRDLEHDFVVVQWDMRGAGKSYRDDIPPESVAEDQLLSDLHEVTQYVCSRTRHTKVYLVGHSFGSYLGLLAIQRYPELFHAFVGVGQVADYSGRAPLERAFIIREAQRRGRLDYLTDLDHADAVRRRQLVVGLGGDVHAFGGRYPFVIASLDAPEYSWPDYFRYVAGLGLYKARPELFRPDPTNKVRRVDVPVYFFLGRYDAVTPPELSDSYLRALSAPYKEAIWFERSGHWSFLEQPEEFLKQMRAVVAETE